MAKMSQEVMDLFKDPQALKVLATVDAAGIPNVAPKGSLTALDEETIAFADVSGGKTRSNLEATKKVAVAVVKSPAAHQIKGTFQEFQTSGPVFDNFTNRMKSMEMTPTAVAIIKVEEVYSLAPGKK
ncbi:MAG: pyridoxamine 5'-phosphate oxidase family protein [Chloroflexota bacterium]|nr:pyridoxamine 5'-phosphate oxidase family protein [Chloroflexota bacterium]